MKKCSYCGADLPENSRFCGKCGSAQVTIATDVAAIRSNTPPPQSWVSESGTLPATWPPYSNYPAQGSTPAWSPNVPAPTTPPPVAENEDERRRGILPWSPLYGAAIGGDALMGSGQAYSPGAPGVQGMPQVGGQAYSPGTPGMQGTPQIGSVSGVAGSPTPYTNAPAGPPAQPLANAPIAHPAQGLANAPGGPPARPVANAPYPQARPQPTHSPPAQPGTQDHHPAYQHHEHRTHRTQHTAASATKAAGGAAAKAIILVVAAAVVAAAGGIGAAHFLSRPQPLISIASKYKVGNTPAGAKGTILHISGQKFSSNSAIIFLLDGHVAPGNPGTRSDSNGNVSADVTITDAWSVGTHTLTARDASNYSTNNSVSVTIVQPGQANTPGPNGAPPDDASFRLNVTVQVADPLVGEPFARNPVLIITGHPDPEGGTVCSPADGGQPFAYNGTTYNNGTSYTEAGTAACSGTYKAGQISYTETDTSVKISWQFNGVNVNCALNNPAVILRLTGAYAGNDTFSGTINYPYVPYPCDQQGYSFWQEALTGTWTGTIVTQ